MQNVSVTSSDTTKKSELKQNINKQDAGLSAHKQDISSDNKLASINSESPLSSIKKNNDRAILASSLQVSVEAGNQPMALLFKTAIENINDVLENNGMGENSIQSAYESGLDVSPKATAERILTMSLSFFSPFQKQHPELSTEASAQLFTEVIGGGIDKGFEEARKLLDGMKVLEGDIASNIDMTYDHVQEGLTSFLSSYSSHDE